MAVTVVAIGLPNRYTMLRAVVAIASFSLESRQNSIELSLSRNVPAMSWIDVEHAFFFRVIMLAFSAKQRRLEAIDKRSRVNITFQTAA